jgi:hypothetical protein
MQHHPGPRARQHPRDRDLAGLVGVLGGAQSPARDRQHRRRQLAGVPVTVRQRGQPALDARRDRLDLPIVGEHDQTGRVRTFRVGSLPNQQGSACPFGQRGRHQTDERQLSVVELWLAGLAVQPQRPPYLPGRGAQGGDELLVTAQGHVRVPAGAAGRVPAGGLVQRGDPSLGAGDIDQLVDVLLVVLVKQPFRRQLGDGFVEVAGDQQRGRVHGEPARRPVMGDGPGEHLGRCPPEAHQVQAPNVTRWAPCSIFESTRWPKLAAP